MTSEFLPFRRLSFYFSRKQPEKRTKRPTYVRAPQIGRQTEILTETDRYRQTKRQTGKERVNLDRS